MFFSLVFPAIDPVMISIGPLSIHWYAVSYIAGIILGIYYLQYLNKKPPQILTAKALDDLMIYAVLGILIGGRAGYVLFYNASFFAENPMEILKLWHGGMSFHGGLVGLITAIYCLCRKHALPFIPVADLIACVSPIGLMLGRIANFINGELYGRVTDAPWGMIFPNGGPLPRHPSQLYESALEGALLLGLLSLLALCTSARKKPGLLLGVFLLGYGIARGLVENFREPDEQIGFLFASFTMGQLLCTPMIVIGIYLIIRALNTTHHHAFTAPRHP